MYVRLKHQQSQNNNTEIPENGCGRWKFQKILVGVGLHITFIYLPVINVLIIANFFRQDHNSILKLGSYSSLLLSIA